MDDDWIFDPSMAGLNRSIEKELREEAEEIESIVRESEIRSRHVSDVARELRNQGQLVTVATSHRDFNGFIIYAAGDFVTLRCETVEVDVSLSNVSFIRAIPSERKRGMAGLAAGDGPGTFEMRLVERVAPRERVEVGFAQRSESLYGNLVATGQDHVIVIDEQKNEWVLPYSAIAFVARGGSRRTR